MALHNYKIQAGIVNLSKAVRRSQFRCLGLRSTSCIIRTFSTG
nr:MAG TPA_asm: hypothetical protein [Caudoviricetes sp.]